MAIVIQCISSLSNKSILSLEDKKKKQSFKTQNIQVYILYLLGYKNKIQLKTKIYYLTWNTKQLRERINNLYVVVVCLYIGFSFFFFCVCVLFLCLFSFLLSVFPASSIAYIQDRYSLFYHFCFILNFIYLFSWFYTFYLQNRL